MKRRELLQMGGVAGGGMLAMQVLAAEKKEQPEDQIPAFDSAVTAIVIGAGNRGHDHYANWIRKNPGCMKAVGVAEPLAGRRQRMIREHGIEDRHVFTTWEHVFEQPKFADAVIIATPDDLHHGPAMAALEKGYDVLLEKPVGMDWKECEEILALQRRTGRIVGVCHVLRFAPYFNAMKEVLSAGAIGEIVDMQHMEPVGHTHYSHSYVRGIWANTKSAAPFLLAKSCHDLDIVRWMIGKPCRSVSSFGSRGVFTPDKAPAGATDRCTDGGCPQRDTCLYAAERIYLKEKRWNTRHLVDGVNQPTAAMIEKALREGPYGRCVWKCDNNQVDRQVVNMEFDGGLPVSFHLCIGDFGGRQTRITGTAGSMRGDMKSLDVYSLAERRWIQHDVGGWRGGHGGGDAGLIAAFAKAVNRQDPSLLATTLAESMESHLIGYRAEESRVQGGRPLEVVPAGKDAV
jgi:predicted dehydrogenase